MIGNNVRNMVKRIMRRLGLVPHTKEFRGPCNVSRWPWWRISEWYWLLLLLMFPALAFPAGYWSNGQPFENLTGDGGQTYWSNGLPTKAIEATPGSSRKKATIVMISRSKEPPMLTDECWNQIRPALERYAKRTCFYFNLRGAWDWQDALQDTALELHAHPSPQNPLALGIVMLRSRCKRALASRMASPVVREVKYDDACLPVFTRVLELGDMIRKAAAMIPPQYQLTLKEDEFLLRYSSLGCGGRTKKQVNRAFRTKIAMRTELAKFGCTGLA